MQMWFVGSIERSDLEHMREVMAEMLAEGAGCYLLGDMHECTGVAADARKYMADWSKSGGDMVSGSAVYGVSFPVRTVVNLALSAIKFLRREPGELVMVRDEGEGRQWVAARVAELG